MKFREVDRQVTYAEQLDGDEGPIELINLFTMDIADVDLFLRVWSDDAAFMKRQPGFVRTQLHRGTGGSATFVNIATWESATALRTAFTSPEFRAAVARYPHSVEAAPQVCTPVAVPGICTA
ncbi:antibiotic biosynthesis monooxygenase family protein [Pseudonocardia tropica]|uniref:Antibiotic biosynthesis monooxygenase family protein n=1 Tax=Pseudonocardia tropica TaxID=681289 RepID=A0ABV1JXQ6_9PSEU